MIDRIVVVDSGQVIETTESAIIAKDEADRAEKWAKYSEEQANLASNNAIAAAASKEAAAQSAQSAANTVNGFDAHAADKQQDFDDNAESKTNTYNSNASTLLQQYTDNAAQKLSAYNSNDATKTQAFNDNYTAKLNAFNSNATTKTNDFNRNASEKQAQVDASASAAKTSETNASNSANLAESWAIGNITDRPEGSAKYWAGQAAQGQVQVDWNQADDTQKDFIKNKPTKLSQFTNDTNFVNTTQLNTKQNTITGGATTITSANLTVNRALISNGSGKVAVSAVTSTELEYLDGVTSAIQTQLNGKALADLSNVTTAGKQAAVSWGMPNYAAGVSVSFPLSASKFTAPSKGIYMVNAKWAGNNDGVNAFVNGTKIASGGNSQAGSAYIDTGSSVFIPLDKGDILYFGQACRAVRLSMFYPMKGV
jgi:hypothetical protein